MGMEAFQDAPGLVQAEKGLVIPDAPELKAIDLDDAAMDYDFGKKLEEMASANNGAENESSLQISEIDFGTLATADDIKELSPEEKYLQEIIVLVKKEEYNEALDLANKLLSESSNHHEGTYFAALCHEKLGNSIGALESLFTIHQANIDHKIASRIHTLKERIRRHLKTQLLLDSLVLKPGKVCQKIERIASLDPDCEFYYIVWCSLLMKEDRVQEAYDCLITGLTYVKGEDATTLSNLKGQVEKRLLEELLRPAADYYHVREFKKAIKYLDNLNSDLKKMKLCVLFRNYLQQLGGGLFGFIGKKKRLESAELKGKLKDVERLQSIIFYRQLGKVNRKIKQERLEDAINILCGIRDVFPEHSYANFLIAGCTYKRVSQQFFQGDFSDIEGKMTLLETAKKQLHIARKGVEKEAIDDLLEQIDIAYQFFKKIKDEIDKRKKEANRINKAIKEFLDIMEHAKKGITSVEMFENIIDRMKALKAQTKEIMRKTTQDENRKTMGQLQEAIENNLDGLKEMEKTIESQKKEARIVNEPQEKFKSIMDSVKGGIKSEDQVDDLKSQLNDLKSSLPTYKNKVSSKEAKEALDQLGKTIDQSMTQLDDVKKSAAESNREASLLNGFAEEFNSLMESMNSGGGISSVHVAEAYYKNLSDLFKRLYEEKFTSKQAQDAKDTLLKNIGQVSGQIHKALGKS